MQFIVSIDIDPNEIHILNTGKFEIPMPTLLFDSHISSVGNGSNNNNSIIVKDQDNMNVSSKKNIKILFLAANPLNTNRIRLDEEVRSIELSLRQSEFRERFEIVQHWAIRTTDLQGYFLRHKPDIVHFSGHGSHTSEIILEDGRGIGKPVSIRALSSLFKTIKDNVRCVVLNACYSEGQARAIAQHIDCVVGMSDAIGDAAAISFAGAFYQALGYGRDLKTAFELGCGQVDIEGLDEQNTPKLIAKKRRNPSNVFFLS